MDSPQCREYEHALNSGGWAGSLDFICWILLCLAFQLESAERLDVCIRAPLYFFFALSLALRGAVGGQSPLPCSVIPRRTNQPRPCLQVDPTLTRADRLVGQVLGQVRAQGGGGRDAGALAPGHHLRARARLNALALLLRGPA